VEVDCVIHTAVEGNIQLSQPLLLLSLCTCPTCARVVCVCGGAFVGGGGGESVMGIHLPQQRVQQCIRLSAVRTNF
jgi:hypothetical protein